MATGGEYYKSVAAETCGGARLNGTLRLKTSRKSPPALSLGSISAKTVPRTVLSHEMLVGERGFEPPAPASRRQCSTRLSYSPTGPPGKCPGRGRGGPISA